MYISGIKRWIRLDARGNKEGVNAHFSIDKEQLAFSVNPDLGEEDILVVYNEPDMNVLASMNRYELVKELFDNLPTTLLNQ
ncbi:hypothetical protein [Vallitalea pronyensis]|uniref:hypothetical protein n=1 Tax=Vallitalea pronyensis TaxID=1348613 RepID=UPI001BAE9165|nr:hypothetical protein [Vallitalea pronyensis]